MRQLNQLIFKKITAILCPVSGNADMFVAGSVGYDTFKLYHDTDTDTFSEKYHDTDTF